MAVERPPELEPARVVLELPVLWGNQDAFGHVNNTVYFLWYESARILYLEEAELQPLMDERQLGPILAAIDCNYRRQVNYPDRVLISARVTEMGRSSMKMAHVVYSTEQKSIVADGTSTVVVFDYAINRPKRIFPKLRQRIAAFDNIPPEPPSLRRRPRTG